MDGSYSTIGNAATCACLSEPSLQCACSEHATPAKEAKSQIHILHKTYCSILSAKCFLQCNGKHTVRLHLWFSKHLHARVGSVHRVAKAYPGYGSQRSWVDEVCILACGAKLPLNYLHNRFDTSGQVNDMHLQSELPYERDSWHSTSMLEASSQAAVCRKNRPEPAVLSLMVLCSKCCRVKCLPQHNMGSPVGTKPV